MSLSTFHIMHSVTSALATPIFSSLPCLNAVGPHCRKYFNLGIEDTPTMAYSGWLYAKRICRKELIIAIEDIVATSKSTVLGHMSGQAW